MAKNRLTIDHAVGPQPFFHIQEAAQPGGTSFTYTITVSKPDGSALMQPFSIVDPVGPRTIAFATAQAMSKEAGLAYGYDDQPYLWLGNRWANADAWMKALSTSMDGLLGTGHLAGKNSRCFYNTMLALWNATSRRPLELKPFGRCEGIPVEDAVIVISSTGDPHAVAHAPDHQNLHVLPVKAREVIDAYMELVMGLPNESLLMRFLTTSLTDAQLIAIRRWFGLHLVVHRVGNPEKMLYMFGPGGNGKSVVVGLLRGLLSDDAVAALRLDDLKTPAKVELLVGKLAMIGAEATAATDNELLKSIVSWEELTVNPKFRDPYPLKPQCLVTQASNPAPRFNDDSDAMVRRVIAIEMEFQPSTAERVVGIAEKVKATEYPLLVAFALQGATEVIEAGTIVVPADVAEFSARVVRPIRAVDRFVQLLEYGAFEVADDELYAAYCLTCQRQRLPLRPKAEFLDELVDRLARGGTIFVRRSKAVHYSPQVHITDRGERALLVPQLKAAKSVDIFLGLRIAEGDFGPPIGQHIHEKRRDVPKLLAKSAREMSTVD